jgi:2Fe-2S ferredoxin
MASVCAVDRDGHEHIIEARSGAVLMRVLKDNGGMDVEATCGGNCMCGTCHVYVDHTWLAKLPPPDELEAELLEQLLQSTDRSRLSCQVKMTDDLDGLRLQLAPPE